MDDFILLKRFIEQTLGIHCSNYKEDYIKRRLLSRMRSTSNGSYDDYLRYLKANPPELENLRNALTINVTEFFRDNDVYVVVPEKFGNINGECIPQVLQFRGVGFQVPEIVVI